MPITFDRSSITSDACCRSPSVIVPTDLTSCDPPRTLTLLSTNPVSCGTAFCLNPVVDYVFNQPVELTSRQRQRGGTLACPGCTGAPAVIAFGANAADVLPSPSNVVRLRLVDGSDPLLTDTLYRVLVSVTTSPCEDPRQVLNDVPLCVTLIGPCT